MGYVLVPLAALLFWLGMLAQVAQQSLNLPGAGQAGAAENAALAAAELGQRYGVACLGAATATPGLISSSIAVSVSVANGASIALPTGAGCMTTSAGAGTRNVFAYMSPTPGAASLVMSEGKSSAVWYRAGPSGLATNLSTAAVSAVPTSIPAGSLVAWVQVNP